MTLKQLATLRRTDFLSNVAYVVEVGLGMIANNFVENPAVRLGCKITGKSTGFAGMITQGAATGSILGGGPAGATVGAVIGGAAWCVFEILSWF